MKGVEVMVADPTKNCAMAVEPTDVGSVALTPAADVPAPVLLGAALDPEVPGANNTDNEEMGDE